MNNNLCKKLLDKLLKFHGYKKQDLMKLVKMTDYRTFLNKVENEDLQLTCLFFLLELKLSEIEIGKTIKLSEIDFEKNLKK